MSTCDNSQNPPEVEALFPEGSAPESRVNKVSALCSYGMRPHVMTGFLRQLLIGHFTDPSNIESPQIRRHVEELLAWKPSDTTEAGTAPGVLVDSITRWNPSNTDRRPAVLIKRNEWQWQRKGIGDNAASNVYTGSTSYAGFWEGSHTLFCLAQNGAEAEFLTTEVVKFLVAFSPMIRDQMDLHRFYVGGVGGVSEVQEVIQGYAIPVTVAYIAEEVWKLQPYAPRLKRIVFKASELLEM